MPPPDLARRAAEVAAAARLLLDQHGLTGWSFAYNRRKRSLGLCVYRGKRIELSTHLVARNGDDEVRDTLLHEIAHALTGPGHGHDDAWKAVCLRIGARPERLASDADMPQGAWLARCPGCGTVHSRHRRPRRLIGWFCRPCGPSHGSLVWARASA
jgi:predicted SprT family Zn-dependent metalloprotease